MSYGQQINNVGALKCKINILTFGKCGTQPRPIDLFISQKQTKKDRSELKNKYYDENRSSKKYTNISHHKTNLKYEHERSNHFLVVTRK